MKYIDTSVKIFLLCTVLLFITPLVLLASVPNDSCSHATIITVLPDTVHENTRLATADPADPVLNCNSGTGNGKTVWFEYTADSTQYISFSTEGSAPTDSAHYYDTTIGLFTGACGDLTLVACNDDLQAGVVRQSRIIYKVIKNSTYHIMVGEWNGGGPGGGVPTGGDLLFTAVPTSKPIIVKGPKVGSWHGGTVLNTNSFENVPLAFNKEHENGEREAAENSRPVLLPPPPGMKQARAPKGSNYFEDRSVFGLPTSTAGTHSEIDFKGFDDDGYIPPDVVMDVGPDHVLAMVNSQFSIFDKNGTLLKNIDANTWYGHIHTPSGFSDPQVTYDHYAKRWIMGGISTDNPNFIYISVSDDSNPLGVWYNWAIPATKIGDSVLAGGFCDHPQIGLDDQGLYIETRLLPFFNKVTIIPKAQLYQASPNNITLTDFYDFRDPDNVDNGLDYMKPVISWGNPGKGFIMSTSPYTLGTFVTLWTINDPVGTPSIDGVNIPVTEYLPPPPISQYQGGLNLENLAPLPSQKVIYRDSSLWMAHCVASGSQFQYAAVSYVRINPFTQAVLEDYAFGKEGFWRFYPGIMVNANKDLVINYSQTGLHTYPGAYFTGRHNADPPGLSVSTPLKEGAGHYVKDYGGGRNRWGDYNGIGLDPKDTSRIWIHTEYAAAPNTWGTWIGKITVDPAPGKKISVDQTQIHFARYETGFGKSDTTIFTVTNLGSSMLTISSISLPDSNYVVYSPDASLNSPISLPSLATFSVNVAFVPKGRQDNPDSIVIHSDDPVHPNIAIHMDGTSYILDKPSRGVLYAGSGNLGVGQVFTVNPATGTSSLIGATGYDKIYSARIDPVSGQWIGLVTPSTLVRIDASFGDAHVFSTITPIILALKGMAYFRDTLYMANAAGNIYQVNPATGTWTLVCNTGLQIAGMDFEPASGQLYVSVRSGALDRIFKVSLPAGTSTLVGQTGTAQITQDILFDGRGNLYGLSGSNVSITNLIKIDTATGHGTLIGSMGYGPMFSLAMIPDSILGSKNFGLISTLTTKQDSFVVHNPNSYAVSFSHITLSDSISYSASPMSASLNTGDSVKLYVTFHPQLPGPKPCTMELDWNQALRSGTFMLSGSGYTPGTVHTAELAKWNLVSVPLTVADLRKDSLFPAGTGHAYGYAGTYLQKDTLGYGSGYWMRFPAAQSVSFNGNFFILDTIPVQKNWNLIGSLSYGVLSSSLVPLGNHVVSSVYGYKNGYTASDSIIPGKGYWVKVDTSGKVILRYSGAAPPKAGRNMYAEALDALSTLTIEDASGNKQVLYFGKKPDLAGITPETFELPPTPPAGVFDARYGSGGRAEFFADGTDKEFPVLLSSADYPVKMNWNVKSSEMTASLHINAADVPMKDAGEYRLTAQPSGMRLKLNGSAAALPVQFALDQNYPNPFNPTTVIRYALPKDSRVTLKIYDVLGQEVATLVDGVQSAGFRNVTWNSTNSSGQVLPSGMYFYRMQALPESGSKSGAFVQTKKLVLLK